MTHFTIRAINLDSDEEMRQLNELARADDLNMMGVSTPVTVEQRRAGLTESSFRRDFRWVAEIEGEDGAGQLVGIGLVSLPLEENLDTAQVALAIHPDFYGRGVGSALADKIREKVEESGRERISTWGWSPVGADISSAELPWNKIASRLGVEAKNTATFKGLDLPLSPAVSEEIESEIAGHAGDYRLETWTSGIPEGQLENYGVVLRQLDLDEPTGAVQNEAPVYTAERVREMQQRLEARGMRAIITVAFAPDGSIAAQTEINYSGVEGNTVAFQENTLVMPAHRGHRLGTAVKLANYRVLAQEAPGIARIFTGNSDLNSHMNAINDRFGFKPVYTEIAYQS